ILKFRGDDGEKEFHPSDADVMPDFPEMTVLTFKDVIPIKKFIKKKLSGDISIYLVREKLETDKTATEDYDIEMLFKSQIISSDEQLAKMIKYTNTLFKVGKTGIEIEKPDKDDDDLTVWFNKETITLNGEAFKWSDDDVSISK
ncbi:MAG: hypothetical protein HQK69_08340, partial [Desulfamplus sp.]|nr:hypothetical protein [Desulfamplus sp.]